MLLARPSVGIGQCFPAQICNSCGQSNHQVDMDDPARNYLVWKNIRTNIESGVTLEGEECTFCNKTRHIFSSKKMSISELMNERCKKSNLYEKFRTARKDFIEKYRQRSSQKRATVTKEEADNPPKRQRNSDNDAPLISNSERKQSRDESYDDDDDDRDQYTESDSVDSSYDSSDDDSVISGR